MIILGDSTTHGGGAFHPGIAEPVVEDEDGDAEEEAEEGGTNDVPNADFIADAAAVDMPRVRLRSLNARER